MLALAGAALLGGHFLEPSRVAPAAPVSSGTPAVTPDAIARAFVDHRSGIEVTGRGTVTRILPDDSNGSPHQRFILQLPSGQTLLVAHNTALAERVPALKIGDAVQFKGEYEWNSQGGVIHWTHHDPRGRHPAGWLQHGGRTFR